MHMQALLDGCSQENCSQHSVPSALLPADIFKVGKERAELPKHSVGAMAMGVTRLFVIAPIE